MNSEINYCKLVNSGRLNDRFLTAQIQSSSDPEKSNMGKLYCLIEITKPWNISYQIGQSIINNLVREYYKGDSTSILVNFENALKKVNENLSFITQNGETEWIGNLNGILALILDDQIHLATTGKIYTCLFRNNKLTNISESNNEPAHPLQTFGEITSGSLEKNDTILIGSSKLLNFLPLENLKNALSGTAYTCVNKITQQLQKNKIKNINLIVLKNISADEKKEPTTVYLDQQQSHFFINFTNTTKNLAKSLKDYWQNKIHPQIKNQLKNSKIIHKSKELSIKTFHSLKKNFARHKNNTENKEETPYNIYHYTQKKNREFSLAKSGLLKLLANIKNKTAYFTHWVFAKKNRSLTYIGIILALIIILIANVGILRRKQDLKNKELATQNSISLIKTNYTEAKLALNYNKDRAKTLFLQIITDAQNIKNNSEIETIFKDSQQKLDELTVTTRFNSPKLIASFSDSSFLFLFQNKFITVGKKDGKIYYQDLSENQVNQYASLPKDSGNIQTGLVTDDNSAKPYFFTDKNKIFSLKDPILTPDQISPKEGNWENAVSIASFMGNLYFLDSTAGQIFKHTQSTDGYSKGEEYLNAQEVDIRESVSLAIDGSVYVLTKNGSVIKLIKGKDQNFSLKNIPTPSDKINQPKLIKTTTEDSYLYILDGNRILEFDKAGKFLKQFAFSSDINNIQDFIINETNKTLLVLSANKLYSVDI